MSSKGTTYYHCYLLQSQVNKRTYIGFTIDPTNRLSQHNGLKKGGAWRTKKYRPWKIVLIISNFDTKVHALQFEWIWQHPYHSKILKHYLKKSKYFGVYGKLELLAMVFLLKDIEYNVNLNIWFLDCYWKDVFLNILKKNELFLPNGILCEVRSLESMPYYQQRQQKKTRKRNISKDDESSVSDKGDILHEIEDSDDNSQEDSSSSSIISFDENDQDEELNELIRLAFEKNNEPNNSDNESSSASSNFSFDENDQDLNLNELIRLAFDKDNLDVSSNNLQQNDTELKIDTRCDMNDNHGNLSQSLCHIISPSNVSSFIDNENSTGMQNNLCHSESRHVMNNEVRSDSDHNNNNIYEMKNTPTSNVTGISRNSICDMDRNSSDIDPCDISIIDLCD